MTEFTPQQIMDRGQEAKRILESPVFQDACLAEEDALVAMWQSGQTTVVREEAFYQLSGLKKVLLQLRVTMSRGEVASHDAEKQKRADTANSGG